MSETHEGLFGELRSLAAAPPNARTWGALLELACQSHEHSPRRHEDVIEPYLLGALRGWPDEVRRARLIKDRPHIIALAKTLTLECSDDAPSPSAVEAHLMRELHEDQRARITRLDLLECVHQPLDVLELLAANLPNITGVYAHVYYDPDHHRATRRHRLNPSEASDVVDVILDDWGPRLQRLGFSSFGATPTGDTANDHAWGRVLRDLERLPALRALEIHVADDSKRWDVELLGDPRLAHLEEVSLNLFLEDVIPESLTRRPATSALKRLKITNCPSTVARRLLESPSLSSVRRWELLPSTHVRAPIAWGSRLGAYWAGVSGSCPETLDDVFSTRWLNTLDLDNAQTKDVLFDGKKARRSGQVEGVSLRSISPRDLKRFLRAMPAATPHAKHLHIHHDHVMRPVDVRIIHTSGLVDQLESLSWRYTHATGRSKPYGAGIFADQCRAEWYELVADETLHPALRQRAWRCVSNELEYKDSFIALARAMGLKGLSRKTIPQLSELVTASAPAIVHEPLMLDATTPPELTDRYSNET